MNAPFVQNKVRHVRRVGLMYQESGQFPIRFRQHAVPMHKKTRIAQGANRLLCKDVLNSRSAPPAPVLIDHAAHSRSFTGARHFRRLIYRGGKRLLAKNMDTMRGCGQDLLAMDIRRSRDVYKIEGLVRLTVPDSLRRYGRANLKSAGASKRAFTVRFAIATICTPGIVCHARR